VVLFSDVNLYVVQITDDDSELKFCQALTALLEQHREVVTMLAEGFTDCRRHIQVYITALCDFSSSVVCYLNSAVCAVSLYSSTPLKRTLGVLSHLSSTPDDLFSQSHCHTDGFHSYPTIIQEMNMTSNF